MGAWSKLALGKNQYLGQMGIWGNGYLGKIHIWGNWAPGKMSTGANRYQGKWRFGEKGYPKCPFPRMFKNGHWGKWTLGANGLFGKRSRPTPSALCPFPLNVCKWALGHLGTWGKGVAYPKCPIPISPKWILSRCWSTTTGLLFQKRTRSPNDICPQRSRNRKPWNHDRRDPRRKLPATEDSQMNCTLCTGENHQS